MWNTPHVEDIPDQDIGTNSAMQREEINAFDVQIEGTWQGDGGSRASTLSGSCLSYPLCGIFWAWNTCSIKHTFAVDTF